MQVLFPNFFHNFLEIFCTWYDKWIVRQMNCQKYLLTQPKNCDNLEKIYWFTKTRGTFKKWIYYWQIAALFETGQLRKSSKQYTLFWIVHTRYTVSASIIMRFTTVRAVEAATRRQNVYRKTMCKRSLQNLSGRTALSVSLRPTGQMFPVNSKHLSTAAHRGDELYDSLGNNEFNRQWW